MSESIESLRKRALELYKPPFNFKYGYIFDSNGEMVADNNGTRDGQITDSKTVNLIIQVRGWGRISYKENPEALQDMVGQLIVESLNEYWRKSLQNE